MDIHVFKQSISGNLPPVQLTVHLKALWYDAKGNWQKAHELVQDLKDSNSSLIHAYLHRKEGDNDNADFWYRRAGRDRPILGLAEEWEQIAGELL